MNINWHKILMNLKGYACLNLRQISELSNIGYYKIQRISKGDNYRLDWDEALMLLDLHYDECLELHTEDLWL